MTGGNPDDADARRKRPTGALMREMQRIRARIVPGQTPCPHCDQLVSSSARSCRHCGKELPRD